MHACGSTHSNLHTGSPLPARTQTEMMLYLIWLLAVVGVTKTIFFFHKLKALQLVLYLIMGWSIVIIGEPVYQHMPTGCFRPLLLGGICYSIGTVFFRMDGRIPFAHAIWHVFVLVAALIHLSGVFECLYR
jgi:channel protein (hemolysin III family)